jgi:hypothetical protein
MDLPHGFARLRIGRRRNRTGVQNDDIRLGGMCGMRQSLCQKPTAKGGGVCFGGTATKVFDEESLRGRHLVLRSFSNGLSGGDSKSSSIRNYSSEGA